jgi:hypothetical protein
MEPRLSTKELEEDITSKLVGDDKGVSCVDIMEDLGSYSGDKVVKDIEARIVRMETEDLGRGIQRSVPKAARNWGFATSRAVRLVKKIVAATFDHDEWSRHTLANFLNP